MIFVTNQSPNFGAKPPSAMINYFYAIIFFAVIGCSPQEHILNNRIESDRIVGLYCNGSIQLEDRIQKEFLYFDGNGLVYYLVDSIHSSKVEMQRVLENATKAKISVIEDSIIFELDSFFIGKGTFEATIFDEKVIYGEDKIYYHDLMQKYCGTYRNDTLQLSILSVSMKKDTLHSSATYTRYLVE